MELCRQEVSRRGKVGGVYGTIHQPNDGRRGGVLDERGDEPDEEVHTGCQYWEEWEVVSYDTILES